MCSPLHIRLLLKGRGVYLANDQTDLFLTGPFGPSCSRRVYLARLCFRGPGPAGRHLFMLEIPGVPSRIIFDACLHAV